MKIKFRPQTRGKVVIFHTLSPYSFRKETKAVRTEANLATVTLLRFRLLGLFTVAANLWKHVYNAGGGFFLALLSKL